jgi:hypothetical protein
MTCHILSFLYDHFAANAYTAVSLLNNPLKQFFFHLLVKGLPPCANQALAICSRVYGQFMKLVFLAAPFSNPLGAHVEILYCGFLGIFLRESDSLDFQRNFE